MAWSEAGRRLLLSWKTCPLITAARHQGNLILFVLFLKTCPRKERQSSPSY